MNYFNFILFLTTCTAIFSLGFLDDKYNISASIKFIVITILVLLILGVFIVIGQSSSTIAPFIYAVF